MPSEETLAAPSIAGDTLLRRRLEAAMQELPDGMRQVLILHDIEGFTHDEIGDMLGVTAGTSKSQLFKSRVKMRTLLQGLKESSDDGAEVWKA